MSTWGADVDVTQGVEPSSNRRRRSPSGAHGGALPFSPLEPGKLASALLGLPDPISTLRRWLGEAALPDLARVLHTVVERLDREERSSCLTVRHIDLSLGDRALHLDLLLLPSIFVPEAWSLTFLEGLLQKPLRDYAGKRLIELGTGSGWISLALLRITGLERALGLDLNPEAVLMARLNAVLNGYDREGAPLADRLVERFEAEVSDLLEARMAMGHAADLVVGCIPQVIAPSVDLASTEGLHDLGNYCVAQGLVEDGLGLGLNARALREALSVLSPGGSVILNLAGRPGPEALRRMFQRRGFTPEILWRSRIEQAADTDIAPLVELEARHGRSFAFYLHRHSPDAVSARLALEVRRAGRPVFHDLYVIEGRPRSARLPPLAAVLEQLDLDVLREEVDLSAASDEQLRFVTRLAEQLQKSLRAPYPHEAGDIGLREKVTHFLWKFHGLSVAPAEVFAAPGRAHLIQSLLTCLVAPGERVVASERLRGIHEPLFTRFGVDAVWVHDDGEEIVELLPLLAPRFAVLSPSEARRADRKTLSALLRSCEGLNALLVLDLEDDLEIGARTTASPLFTFLDQHQGSAHLAVLFGLRRRPAASQVDLALLLSRHPRLMTALEAAAEITYSRMSWFDQAYYDSLFDGLTSLRASAAPPEASSRPLASPAPPLSTLMEATLRAPAFARPAPGPGVIRLDYGENELSLPKRLAAGILEGFLRRPEAGAGGVSTRRETIRAACAYLRQTRLPEVDESQVLLGHGTLPLLFDALSVLVARLGRAPKVLLPRGSYGIVLPMLAAAGCEASVLASAAPDFLATVAEVDAAGDFDVLLLTNPANPSGAAYAPEVLRHLIQRCAARGARVVLDEVFGMLANLGGPVPVGQDRLSGLRRVDAERVLLLTGTSKEFAAGGLRLGIAATLDTAWREDLAAVQKGPVPLHVQLGAERLFCGFAEHRGELDSMRRGLAVRRDRLAKGLAALGFGVDPRGRGGLSLLVDVSPFAAGDPEGFVLELEARAGVRFGTPSWSGLETHARACFAIAEDRIDQALARLDRALRR